MEKDNITVKSNGQDISFMKLKQDFWLNRKKELQATNRLNRLGRHDRPYETAQQKAAKRAKKFLDSKRQQEVEKLAAEKLGHHEKKCPICEQPFKDVNEFMAHLSKCNVVESSTEGEDSENVDREAKQIMPELKAANWEKDDPISEDIANSGNTTKVDIEEKKTKVMQSFYFP